jgi:DHA1 family bicyclomycin/chloramphenicol resistance-like MFS transporter
MSRSSYLLIVLLLGSLTAMPAFSLDTVLPVLPEMANSLATDAATIQLTISAYIFGAAAGQLLLGPLSDRFGRRPALFAGLIFYLGAAIGCCYADSVEILAFLRFVQGSATFAGRIIPRAIARDMYDREDTARLISYMMVIGGIAPILGPLAGVYLYNSFGWRAGFVFMAAYGAIVFLCAVFFLKETLPQERRIRVNPVSMTVNLIRLMQSRVFLSYGACLFLIMGAVMAFLTSTSSIVVLFLEGSPKDFAWASAIVMLGYSFFSFVSGRLVMRLGIGRLIGLGSVIGAASGLAMLFLALADVNTLWAIMVPMFGVVAALSFVMPAATAGALSPFGDMAGSAMANFGFLQTGFSAAISALVGLSFDGTQMPMVITISILCCALLAVYLVFIRPLTKAEMAC